MIDKESLDGFYGTIVYDSAGDKVGKTGDIYLDDNTDEPTFATVATGLFGSSESFVPLRGTRPDGRELHVEFTKDQIKDAPRVEPGLELTADEEDRLYEHYQLDGGGPGTAGSARPAGPALAAERAEQSESTRLRRHPRQTRDE